MKKNVGGSRKKKQRECAAKRERKENTHTHKIKWILEKILRGKMEKIWRKNDVNH